MLHQIRGKARRSSTNFLGNSAYGGLAMAPLASLSPLLAPDADYLHWVDFSDATRIEKLTNRYVKLWVEKAGSAGRAFSYYVNGGAIEPLDTGSIGGVESGDFNGATLRKMIKVGGLPADLNFMYPSMTVFLMIRPRLTTAQNGIIISDYGNVAGKLIYLKVGDGTNLVVSAFLRDSALNVIDANSGVTYLSLNTDYLIVAKMDGANKRSDLWIDGAVNFNNTNAAYDPTTTWEGTYIAAAVFSLGVLSAVPSNPFQGYVGGMFITKTALSNANINLYANWMAAKWGTTWTQI